MKFKRFLVNFTILDYVWKPFFKVMNMWYGKKKDHDKNLKDIMHYLLDEGRINTTHEAIDKHK